MTWEEIIVKIRKDPDFKDLVTHAYFDADLELNVKRFRDSEEFRETLVLIRKYSLHSESGKLRIADIGAGNGVAAVSFALEGYNVTAVEPDPSNTIGSGAIRLLVDQLHLKNLVVVSSFGEEMPIDNSSMDVVYIRQAMHHAADLKKFVAEAVRILKPGGVLLTTRDHVIFNEQDKSWFLRVHPLHKFYGGENAFTYEEYTEAIRNAGMNIISVLKHYDSVINFSPETQSDLQKRLDQREELVNTILKNKKMLWMRRVPLLNKILENHFLKQLGPVLDETKIAGRLITFIAVKQ